MKNATVCKFHKIDIYYFFCLGQQTSTNMTDGKCCIVGIQENDFSGGWKMFLPIQNLECDESGYVRVNFFTHKQIAKIKDNYVLSNHLVISHPMYAPRDHKVHFYVAAEGISEKFASECEKIGVERVACFHYKNYRGEDYLDAVECFDVKNKSYSGPPRYAFYDEGCAGVVKQFFGNGLNTLLEQNRAMFSLVHRLETKCCVVCVDPRFARSGAVNWKLFFPIDKLECDDSGTVKVKFFTKAQIRHMFGQKVLDKYNCVRYIIPDESNPVDLFVSRKQIDDGTFESASIGCERVSGFVYIKDHIVPLESFSVRNNPYRGQPPYNFVDGEQECFTVAKQFIDNHLPAPQ